MSITLVFDVFAGYGDEIVFMDFCDKLIAHHPDRKIFFIVDNHSIHKSTAVRCWREDHQEHPNAVARRSARTA